MAILNTHTFRTSGKIFNALSGFPPAAQLIYHTKNCGCSGCPSSDGEQCTPLCSLLSCPASAWEPESPHWHICDLTTIYGKAAAVSKSCVLKLSQKHKFCIRFPFICIWTRKEQVYTFGWKVKKLFIFFSLDNFLH